MNNTFYGGQCADSGPAQRRSGAALASSGKDLALANNSLDLIGQARLLYQRVATLRNDGGTWNLRWRTFATSRIFATTRCLRSRTAAHPTAGETAIMP